MITGKLQKQTAFYNLLVKILLATNDKPVLQNYERF